MTANAYQGRTAALATKHHKERAIRGPLYEAVGMEVSVPPGLDTDLLGTFSGEVEREGSPREVVVRKARLGMEAASLRLGLASEGSFRPHPELAFETGCHELLAFVDDQTGVVVVEDLFSLKTNFANAKVRVGDDIDSFLARVGFPAHALIAVPNDRIEIGHDDRVRLVLDGAVEQQLFKGITDPATLDEVIAQCCALSADGLAHLETDMRAHLNPTRMAVIGELAGKLGRRLATSCPACDAPGWGALEVKRGYACTTCGAFNPLAFQVVRGCLSCDHRAEKSAVEGQPCVTCRPTSQLARSRTP